MFYVGDLYYLSPYLALVYCNSFVLSVLLHFSSSLSVPSHTTPPSPSQSLRLNPSSTSLPSLLEHLLLFPSSFVRSSQVPLVTISQYNNSLFLFLSHFYFFYFPFNTYLIIFFRNKKRLSLSLFPLSSHIRPIHRFAIPDVFNVLIYLRLCLLTVV